MRQGAQKGETFWARHEVASVWTVAHAACSKLPTLLILTFHQPPWSKCCTMSPHMSISAKPAGVSGGWRERRACVRR